MVSMRLLGFFLALFLLLVGGSYVYAGRTTPPTLTIEQPTGAVGSAGTLQFTAGAARTVFASVEASRTERQDLPAVQPGGTWRCHREARRRGPSASPACRSARRDSELQQGTAKVVIVATRTSFLRLRNVSTETSKEIQVRLEPPRIAVLSSKHYLNHGGAGS